MIRKILVYSDGQRIVTEGNIRMGPPLPLVEEIDISHLDEKEFQKIKTTPENYIDKTKVK